MKQLPQNYDSKEAEKRWQQHWLAQGTYAWRDDKPRAETYVIDTPPPTVSGLLHMGHIFSYTQADFIARFQRMQGKDVFYPMGFDDNGLPTERLVEKAKKIRAADLGREKFIEECESVAEEARKEFRRLFESVALSVDWKQEYHTISPECRKISQLSFIDLFRKDNAYRKLQPMLWDPVDQTAIAQAEIEDKELASSFNDIYFAIENSDEKIVIGTTRPEMLPACVAIFYHPDDARYQHLKGKRAITPLFGQRVPVMEDDTVEMDKGTGIMMCCTFGDEKDIEKWRKYDLPAIIILNKYGKLETLEALKALKHSGGEKAEEYYALIAGKKASNKDPKSLGAREIILGLLTESGELKESKPITHAVKCAERSGAPLEILPTYQWFVKVLDKKDALKAKVDTCVWHPEYMKLRAHQWIDGLSWDWCISRQRYFGVPFPVWYSARKGEEGKILLADPAKLPVNPLVDLPEGYTREEVVAEADVMDTWATSSVSPQLSSKGITSELAIDSARHKKLFPADLRPQAHEIIRTWAFYTIVKAHLHEDTIPWQNLMISGWCLAADKTKMSKSKGNVVTPVELIEEKGADAVRYWASTSNLGADTAFSEDALKIGRKLVTKLWNASKFASLQLEKLEGTPTTAALDVKDGVITASLDKWILTRLQRAVAKATEEFTAYEYSRARVAVEDFFWNDFCDNYLEMVKTRAYGESSESGVQSSAEQQSAITTIYHCLEGILRLFAPIVPHITEELYSHIFDGRGSIHARGMWLKASDYPVDAAAEQTGIAAVSLLNEVRKAKAEKGVSIKWPVETITLPAETLKLLSGALSDLKAVTSANSIVEGPALAVTLGAQASEVKTA